jgi:HSP20 family protein
MRHESSRCMQSLFRAVSREMRESLWRPPADLYRMPDCWLVKLDLAGVRPDDLRIGVEGAQLIVEGVRRDLLALENAQCLSMEISYLRFQRTVTLPKAISHPEIHWDYRDGMLIVRICEREPAP